MMRILSVTAVFLLHFLSPAQALVSQGSVYSPYTSITDTIISNSAPGSITAGAATGAISGCAGSASVSPNIQQFAVSANGLSGDITATPPPGFEVSLNDGTGYASNLLIKQSAGIVNNTVVFVRSAATASGDISGNVVLKSAGVTTQNVAVSGQIHELPTIDPVADQTVADGAPAAAVNFTGTGNVFNWVNDTPGIGLAASGTGNIASFIATNSGAAPLTATITVTPSSAEHVYIGNGGNGTVSVINSVTKTGIATITVGHDPTFIAISPDDTRVYVVNNSDRSVSVISTATNTVIATIPVGDPNQAIVSSDGNRLYITDYVNNVISVINTITYAVIATIQVGSDPSGLTISRDGSRLYVSNAVANTISVINTTTNVVIATIPTESTPHGLVVSPDGSRLYVANFFSNTVMVINTATNAVVDYINTMANPDAIAISPDGRMVYVTNYGSDVVSVINTATDKVVSTVVVGMNPVSVSVSPDGGTVFIANQRSNNVSVIDAATNKVTTTIPVGLFPNAVGTFNIAGTGCSGVPAKFTITVNTSQSGINATAILADLNTVYGTASPAASTTVSGFNLTSGILVEAPLGLEVGLDEKTFSSSVVVGVAGSIAATPVYIRLAAATHAGTYPGNLMLSSGKFHLNVRTGNNKVSPAPLMITADNKTKIYGEDNPVLTATYKGFVNDEGIAQLKMLPLITTNAGKLSPAGQYTIMVGGALSPDYDFSYKTGVLTVKPASPAILINNTFTPNGDGINDYWEIKNLDSYPKNTVDIYNRYGEKVYSSVGYGIPWNGTYKGSPLPAGTYYYMIDLKNNGKILSGYVVIVK
ncbi:MAG: T9SS type B sorting domain-containing protein [Mucilaginibacter sp.]